MSGNDEGRLKQCEIILTHGCNLRCNFCFEKEAGYRLSDQLGYEDLKRLVDLCGNAGVRYLFLTGGEPLLYPHLIEILHYVSEYHPSITPTIATNGVLLDDIGLCQRLVDAGLRYLDVSMKGASTESWLWSTGCDGFSRQIKAIRNLSAMPVEFTCSMVVTHDNVTEICDAVQVAHDNGAKQFSFTFYIDNSHSQERNQVYLEKSNPFALIQAFVSQVERLCAITDDWWVEYSYPMCVFTEEQLRVIEGRLAGPCQVHLGNAITINTRMELMPCDMYIGMNLGRFGKEFSTPHELEKLLKSHDSQSVLDGIRKLPSPKCALCKYLKRCYGGCPVLWQSYSFESLMHFKAETLGVSWPCKSSW